MYLLLQVVVYILAITFINIVIANTNIHHTLILVILTTIDIITPFIVLNRLTILFQHLISITININKLSYLALVINVNMKFIFPFIYSSSYCFTFDFTGL